MPFFSAPQALRLRTLPSPSSGFSAMASTSYDYGNDGGFMRVFKNNHSSHPDFANLTLLVFEAVMEVVCVSLPGYVIARMGQFDAESQKFLANLNTQLFTPCLIFTKLASQLTADKLSDLAVIPVIFIVQTLVSYLAALLVSRLCGFNKRASNFVVAMAVFGNSNSLPISLVISLSKTLSGLHWAKVPGDNDNEVGARGILYLLIFQQLGQLVRWTWGFNVLLAPASAYTDEDVGKNNAIESGEYSPDEAQRLLDDSHSDYESGNVTSYATSADTSDTDSLFGREDAQAQADFTTPTNGNAIIRGVGDMNGSTNGHAVGALEALKRNEIPKGIKGWPKRTKLAIQRSAKSVSDSTARVGRRCLQSLPLWLQSALSKIYSGLAKFLHGVWEFMNPPLWAMLAAILVASVPSLQHLFFAPGTFVSNSVSRAVSQSGQVAVPLILVVLGANLARNTLPKEDQHSMEDPKVERKLVIASLVSRMLIPTIVMAPMLALTAKYVPISILDDPIFIIVCFLLSGAPSALQLAQICQINNVYMGSMSKILFQSYVQQQPEGSLATEEEPSSCTAANDESTSPQPPSAKVVSFPDESISPLMIGKNKELDQKDYLDLDKTTKQYTASISRKRLSGRPSTERLSSYKPAPAEGNPSLSSLLSDSSADTTTPHGHHAHENLLKQVGAWLKHERTRRHARRAKRKAAKDVSHDDEAAKGTTAETTDQPSGTRGRSGSESSTGSVSLDQLAHILEKTLAIKPAEAKKRSQHIRRLSTGLKRHSAISLDSDHIESVDQLVPGCDVVLDNSKTMAYSIDEPTDDPVTEDSERRARKEKEAWTKFRFEILRIAHTLKLKAWRKIPMDLHDEIDVQRLSGALTNAVYVVSPPKNLPAQGQSGDGTPKPKNPPPKLLLRIYGPQVEHLIDRESELQILTRLARKRIGPRLLGTFQNGRFEEFLNAKALTAKELRIQETSIQIAKRMRELHEGIDLLKHEREAGPFVWQNWDKWVDRCEQIVTWLDQQILESKQDATQSATGRWKERGFVCGVQWPIFRQTVEKYRTWLENQYGGLEKINERMVFSHNDTQYGNILRMEPEGESPLLLPANQHKQLVVIDFEYANANLPGLEFANHFTEWTYNYHDAEGAWRCKTKYYPTVEEQHRFIRAYLLHNPSYKSQGGYTSNPTTPHLGPLPSSGSTTALTATAAPSTISAFMLDSRAPPGEKHSSYQEQEAQAERKTEEECRRLMAETKLWRLANSAMWVAWGIVQAHIPGMPDFEAESNNAGTDKSATKDELESTTAEVQAEAEEEEKNGLVSPEKAEEKGDAKVQTEQETDLFKSQDEEEFDYLAYAHDRAMFLWGDALRMGIVKAEELPEELHKKLKIVEY
ncbi:kinase-like protein [Cucurbitaria berberidis CBS 394.84]|uniref:Kinase-like protein n=1 Tax=Cucurbitaria berberidis CBS 394.84 TaxID=1168544 RepID=A0A9P4GFF1_9PLEO|nr:kinase-like protein [Cucurbitaria berberidis CBS 394.84]KAF1844377.1 kinase-like protein [Cucurbitaria berberidis CBS 394.84]